MRINMNPVNLAVNPGKPIKGGGIIAALSLLTAKRRPWITTKPS
jgi:hypothetical protein